MNIAIPSNCWFHVVSWNKVCLKRWKLLIFTHTFGLFLEVKFWKWICFGISLHNEGQHFFFHPKPFFFLGWKLKSMCRLQSKQVMGESRKKGAKHVWTVLKNYFLKIWKITMGTLYINIYIFEIIFYTFKVATTKFSWKFTMFQESFYMFKALKKSMWIGGFFVSKVFFPYQMLTKFFQFFREI
jgi:hypothetical protein